MFCSRLKLLKVFNSKKILLMSVGGMDIAQKNEIC